MTAAASIVALAVQLALAVENAGPQTVGDSGLALGTGQMHKVAVAEVNRILGFTAFTDADRTDPALTRDMCAITLSWHHARNPRLGVVALASRWNCPYPKQRKCTEGHMRKLEAEYRRVRR